MGNFKKLNREIIKRDSTRLIISGEGISLLSMNNLYEFKNFLISISTSNITFKVIIYVRNHVTWSVRQVQQGLKIGKTYLDSINEPTASLTKLYKNKTEKFVQVFGKENVGVYTFEEAIEKEYGPV
ncbi:hypothetical protein ACFFHM_05880 [Halalkalibacter kiskunsagensis]|uniref:Uncharacterized protein n=1 Tax=Halalkalibacter kiskunsagensis TaxID=1548599 RepID=A0ABV6K9S5_9BACI